MRTTKVTVVSQTWSPWVPLDRGINPFNIGLAVILSSGASLTYSVQHTFDDTSLENARTISISRSGTTATVTDKAHGLSVNDNVLIESSGSTNLDGSYAVAGITSVDVYTYTVANSGATADTGSARAHNFRVFNHAILNAQTTRQDGNYGFPCCAVRLNATTWASGTVDLLVVQGFSL